MDHHNVAHLSTDVVQTQRSNCRAAVEIPLATTQEPTVISFCHRPLKDRKDAQINQAPSLVTGLSCTERKNLSLQQ